MRKYVSLGTFSRAGDKVTAEQEEQHYDLTLSDTCMKPVCFPCFTSFVVVFFVCSFSPIVRTHEILQTRSIHTQLSTENKLYHLHFCLQEKSNNKQQTSAFRSVDSLFAFSLVPVTLPFPLSFEIALRFGCE